MISRARRTAGRRRRLAGAFTALALASGLSTACGSQLARGGPPEAANDASFCAARARIEALRREHLRAWKQTIRLTLSTPVMPQALSARGAVAAQPPDDLRMILLGPGGATAMDLWVHQTTYRFSVPAIGRVIRGDATTPAEKRKGLPVDFLRWWMLDPFGGEVVYAARSKRGLEFVLRDKRRDGSQAYVDGAVLEGGAVEVARTTWSAAGDKLDEEHLTASSIGCGTVSYAQASTRISVEAVCESESPEVNARAFVDPDAPAPPPAPAPDPAAAPAAASPADAAQGSKP